MRRFAKKIGVVGAAVGLALAGTMAIATPASASIDGPSGCPRGYVCLTPNGQHTPTIFFYQYGSWNFNNVYGWYTVQNNQYIEPGQSNARVQLMSGGWGTGNVLATVNAGQTTGVFMTPVNSIRVLSY